MNMNCKPCNKEACRLQLLEQLKDFAKRHTNALIDKPTEEIYALAELVALGASNITLDVSLCQVRKGG